MAITIKKGNVEWKDPKTLKILGYGVKDFDINVS